MIALLGIPTLPLNAYLSGPSYPETVVGGLGCRWYFGDQGDNVGGEAEVSVIPALLATAPEIASAPESLSCDTGSDLSVSNSGCAFGAVIHGWWYVGHVYEYNNATAQAASGARVEAGISSALSTAKPPAAVSPKKTVTCEALNTAIDPAKNLGHGALAFEQADSTVGNAGTSPYTVAVKAGGVTSCGWGGAGPFDFQLEIVGSSTSMYRSCSSRPGDSVSVTGVTSAVAFPADEGSLTMCATDGVSSVILDAGGFDQVAGVNQGTWDKAHLDLASKIIVPVLAALRP